MKNKMTLRKRLGLFKYKLIGCWPYYYHVKKAARLREKYSKMITQLPKIDIKGAPEIEIHMLCGQKYLDMGIWASWSIMRFLDRSSLYVHSDGSLHQNDVRQWQEIIPSMKLIDKETSNNKADKVLKNTCPYLYKWRVDDWCGSHLVDPHLFGESKKIIIMDADVLCFSDPLELKEALNSDCCRWNRDLSDAYSAPRELINKLLTIEMPEKFNAGFCLVQRMDQQDYVYLNSIIEKMYNSKTIDVNHLWSSQTYWAIYCRKKTRDCKPFGEAYNIRKKTSEDCIVRHYVGIPSIRPRYFNEGIPRLLKDLPQK